MRPFIKEKVFIHPTQYNVNGVKQQKLIQFQENHNDMRHTIKAMSNDSYSLGHLEGSQSNWLKLKSSNCIFNFKF